MLVDIGLNLSHAQFDHDRSAVMERAVSAGVTHALLTGTSLIESQRALALAYQSLEHFRATAGVHPHAAHTWDTTVAQGVRTLLMQEGVAAVGECGLDYDRMRSSRAEQIDALNAQLDLGLAFNKPAFLHFRPAPNDDGAALNDFLASLRPRVQAGLRGVVHCFTANEAALEAFLDLGLYIGVTGWVCDERRGKALQTLLPKIPDDRLMVETDAPYLMPRTMPGAKRLRRNEPAFLPYVVDEVARLRGTSTGHVQRSTTLNVQRCFGWPCS